MFDVPFLPFTQRAELFLTPSCRSIFSLDGRVLDSTGSYALLGRLWALLGCLWALLASGLCLLASCLWLCSWIPYMPGRFGFASSA